MFTRGVRAKLFNLLYLDRVDITHATVVDQGNALNNQYPRCPHIEDVPCRISLASHTKRTWEVDGRQETASLNPKIFCNPEIEIRPGDKLTLRRLDSKGKEYSNFDAFVVIAGGQNIYSNHQEVEFSMFGDT